MLYHNFGTLVKALTFAERKLTPYKNIEYFIHYLQRYHGTDWIPNSLYSDTHFSKKVIEHNKNFKVSLISWEPGQHTAFHTHKTSESAFIVLKGKIVESRRTKDMNVVRSNTHFRHTSFIKMDPYRKHKLENIYAGRAATLHLNIFH